MAEEWADRKCEPCMGGAKPLTVDQAAENLKGLKGWRLGEQTQSLLSDYLMKDFAAAVEFINEIMKVAEASDHHPDLHLTGYRKLRVELSTHSIGGLSDNDFILAAKIDRLPRALKA